MKLEDETQGSPDTPRTCVSAGEDSCRDDNSRENDNGAGSRYKEDLIDLAILEIILKKVVMKVYVL